MGHDLPAAGVLADGGSAPASQPAPHAAGQAAMRRPRSRPAVARPAGGAPQEAASGEMPRAASGSLGQVGFLASTATYINLLAACQEGLDVRFMRVCHRPHAKRVH